MKKEARTETLYVRMTPSELAWIRGQADSEDRPAGTYARRRLLADRPAPEKLEASDG